MRHHRPLVLLILILCSCWPAATSVAAPAAQAYEIAWDSAESLPLVDYGAIQLPMRLITLRATGQPQQPVITQLQSAPSSEPIRRVAQPPPGATDQLPEQPVFIIARGTQRGVSMVVVAISPLYQSGGVAMRASALRASLGGVQALGESPAMGARGQQGIAAPTPSPITTQAATKLTVSTAGIQQVAGGQLPSAAIAQLRLWKGETQIALEVDDADGNGVLGAGDTLFFYAPTVGDRWNSTDTYWLTADGRQAALRIGASAAPASGSPRTSAYELGTWRRPALYDSEYPGPQQDHWFSGRLSSFNQFQDTARITATLDLRLPRIAGTATYTITGAVRDAQSKTASHTLRVSTGSASGQIGWASGGSWSQRIPLAQNGPQLIISAINGPTYDDILIDQIAWAMPATLDFSAGGASFLTTIAGAYQLGGLGGARLYDITSPAAPGRIAISGSAFQAKAGHRYLVAKGGTLGAPAVAAYTPPDLGAALAAQVVYIAPSEWASALAPLVALRQGQGYQVAIASPQAIYDTWGGGQISPEAIRSFLRAAYAQGGGRLVSATLVGDGTNDPFDYSRPTSDEQANNINIIPPYLAPVDPWIGETACETCYAQLNGSSPLDDTLPDILIGRIPAKDAAQVGDIAAKIVRYESSSPSPEFASRIGFVADNYNQADGSQDSAGDFAAMADEIADMAPGKITTARMYYDPTVARSGVYEPSSQQAYSRTRSLLNGGAALVNYIGHGYVTQWGVTDVAASPNTLLSLYDPDSFTNSANMPIVLSMTCLTSAFQAPNFYSTSIDERLLIRREGGAVATWGSSGEGVVLGHRALQRGFYQALWRGLPAQPSVGELAQAGYAELLSSDPTAGSAIRTFLILGDPLTPARVAQADHMFLPLVTR